MSSTSAYERLLLIAGAGSLARRDPSITCDSDEQLISRVRSERCTESLSVLFERYARLLFTIANRLLADASEAEEVVQECFLYVFQKAHLFDESKGTGRAWIVSLAYYRAFDRKTTRELGRTGQDVNELSALMDEESDFTNSLLLQSEMRQALALISEQQRQVLEMHVIEGYSFKEIAVKMQESLGNVRHHYYRGIEKLRKALSGAEDSKYDS